MCGQVCGCCHAPRAQAPVSSHLVEQTPAFPHPLSLFCRQLTLQLLSQGVECSSPVSLESGCLGLNPSRSMCWSR